MDLIDEKCIQVKIRFRVRVEIYIFGTNLKDHKIVYPIYKRKRKRESYPYSTIHPHILKLMKSCLWLIKCIYIVQKKKTFIKSEKLSFAKDFWVVPNNWTCYLLFLEDLCMSKWVLSSHRTKLFSLIHYKN